MGGHGHDSHSQPEGPFKYPNFRFPKDKYNKKAATNEDEAHFCGRAPGTPNEGWEIIYGLTFAATFVLCLMAGINNDTYIGNWARAEVLAREKAVANGHTLEFGNYYNTVVEKTTTNEDGIKETSFGMKYDN
jgi:hypothetical protein